MAKRNGKLSKDNKPPDKQDDKLKITGTLEGVIKASFVKPNTNKK